MPGSSGGWTVQVFQPRDSSGQDRNSQSGAEPHWNVTSDAK